MKLVKLCASIPTALVVLTTVASAADRFQLTDLGMLPDYGFSQANGISDSGQVVGANAEIVPGGPFGTMTANGRAVLWPSNGTIQNLGLLNAGHNNSTARAINRSGQAVGESAVLAGNVVVSARAFLWSSSGGMQDLGSLKPGDSYSAAHAINSSAQVVGDTITTDPFIGQIQRGFIWSSASGMNSLGVLPGFDESYASSINDSGMVVGWCGASFSNIHHAFTWTSNGGMQDIGTFPGSAYSYAYAVNNYGQVVGYSNIDTGQFHAFIWSNSQQMQDLGVLPGADGSQALAINDIGDVVGSSYGSTYGFHAAIWTTGGALGDLNNLLDASGAGWFLNTATGINNADQIVGYGIGPDGHTHAVLLTPVPEPAEFALVGCFLVLWTICRSRRRTPL